MNIARQEPLDAHTKLSIQKVVNAAENAFADRAILLDENLLLFEQNNEKTTRTSIKATVVGTAKVLSYTDSIFTLRRTLISWTVLIKPSLHSAHARTPYSISPYLRTKC
jgi:hypothetical protein